MIAAITAIISCATNDEVGTGLEAGSAEKMTLDTFRELGDLHNRFLYEIEHDFIPTRSGIVGMEDGIEMVKEYYQGLTQTLNIADEDKEFMVNGFELFKGLLDSDAMYDDCFRRPTRSDASFGEMNLYQAIDHAYSVKAIDSFERTQLTAVASVAQRGMEESISVHDLERELVSIVNEWEAEGYLTDDEYGALLGSTLAISMASLEYWEGHPDKPDGITPEALAVWVAKDMVGAVLGSVSSGVGSAVTSGKVNWGMVGWSALSGAVIGSTGAVTKIARWIFG